MEEKNEVERKFRVLNFKLLMVPSDAIAVDIRQDYLVSKGPGERRVRRAVSGGVATYTYTEKLPTGESGTRVEKEREISHAEYLELLAELDAAGGCQTIHKVRYRFLYAGRILELDVYTAGRPAQMGLVILEIELSDISEPVELPPGWEVQDVTDDPQYKNRALAAL